MLDLGKSIGMRSPENASKVLASPLVQAYIARITRPALRKLEITAERVLQGLAELAFANIGDYVDIGKDGLARINLLKADRTSLGAIAELTSDTVNTGMVDAEGNEVVAIRTKIKLADKRQALETLARYLKIIGSDTPPTTEPIKVVFIDAPRRVGGTSTVLIEQESRT